MPKLIIDKNYFINGLAKTFSLPNAIDAPDGFYRSATAVTLNRIGYEGHIAPGETFTALTDANARVTHLPLNGVGSSTNNFFAILKNGRIVKFDTSAVDTSFLDPASAVATEFGDIIVLKDVQATPVEYLIFSYETAGSAFIGYVRTSDLAGNNDTFITVTKGVHHVMSIGPGPGNIYFTNGQYVGTLQVSGVMASGVSNTTALSLDPGWIATSLTQYGNYVAVVGYRSTAGTTTSIGNANECRMWLWDGFSPSWNFSYVIPDNYVSKIFNHDGVLKVWTYGKSNVPKVFQFTGGSFQEITHNTTTIMGAYPRHGSVDIHYNKLHWGTSSNEVSGGGQVINVLDGTALHKDYFVFDGTTTATDLGMVKNLNTNLLFVGVLASGPAYKIFKSNPAGYANSDFSSEIRTRLIHLPYRANVKNITVFFSQFGDGASVLLSLVKDYLTFSFGSGNDKLNKTLTFSALASIPDYQIVDKYIPDVSSFTLGIKFNHASVTNTAYIIKRIEIEYEPGITSVGQYNK